MSAKTKKERKPGPRTERRLTVRLRMMFENASTVDSVSTFEDAGIMTMNKGLVVTFANGAEFQITIVRSR